MSTDTQEVAEESRTQDKFGSVGVKHTIHRSGYRFGNVDRGHRLVFTFHLKQAIIVRLYFFLYIPVCHIHNQRKF